MCGVYLEDTEKWILNFKSCDYTNRLLDKVILKNQKAAKRVDVDLVKKAIYYARKYHGSQLRQSGEPYYTHPLEVAYMVSDYLFNTDAIVVSILHDTIEDTDLSRDMIAQLFGEKVANQVDDLTRDKSFGKISAAEMVEILWQAKKYDVLLIKLFDRLHNIKTIAAKSPEKAQKIINETLKYFLVLSEMLELPSLSYHLYKECYNANIKSGLIDEDYFFFSKHSELPDLPIFESEIN